MTGSNGDSEDVAMEGEMAGVVVGVRGMGGKRGSDCSMVSCMTTKSRPMSRVRVIGVWACSDVFSARTKVV